MSALRIAEVSRLSGLAAPTLRYYEQLGLLTPPDRTPAGYRVYDESVLDRLAFISRAKMLGCSLEEIAELIPDWEGGQCAPVQDRLRELAAAKLVEAQARLAHLVTFAGDLRRTLSTLGSQTPDGRCDAGCGCLSHVSSAVTAVPSPPVAFSAGKPAPEEASAIACTLDRALVPSRVRDWHALLAHVTTRIAVDRGVRFELDEATPIEELARLVGAERSCCRFFAFTLTIDERGVGLEVRAPETAQPMLAALFGPA